MGAALSHFHSGAGNDEIRVNFYQGAASARRPYFGNLGDDPIDVRIDCSGGNVNMRLDGESRNDTLEIDTREEIGTDQGSSLRGGAGNDQLFGVSFNGR